MAAWKYIKGGESDFKGAPEWAVIVEQMHYGTKYFLEGREPHHRFKNDTTGEEFITGRNAIEGTIIAQRERVTSVNDDRLAHDMVNHPSHYTQGGIECIDAIKAATVGKSGIEAVCVANVVKYLWRYEEKNGVEDVSKAKWYLERLITELREGKSK